MKTIIDCFLISDFTDYLNVNCMGCNVSDNNIYYNNECIISRKNGDIFIYNPFSHFAIIPVLNAFIGVKAIVKNGAIFINGIQWDGKKTNLELFL